MSDNLQKYSYVACDQNAVSQVVIALLSNSDDSQYW